jgi:hypothetical protein
LIWFRAEGVLLNVTTVHVIGIIINKIALCLVCSFLKWFRISKNFLNEVFWATAV